jgi:enamine deaminase RidA (YjgF/YER057c/UK114 family)
MNRTAISGASPSLRGVTFMNRATIIGSSPWEPIVGYARAVRVGNQVMVAGTTAIGDDGAIVGVGDAYAQTVRILHLIERALRTAGAEMRHVVRTRMFVTDIANWEAVGRAHGEVFGTIRPAATMVEVRRLIDPELLVEIEADAIID